MDENTFTFTVTRQEVDHVYSVELTDSQWEALKKEMDWFLRGYTQDELSRLIPDIDDL